MSGYGLSSVGTSPAGWGSVTNNLQLVADGYSQSKGGCVSSVLIDSGTMDLKFDDYGNEIGMSDVGQRIYILLKTSLGSRVSFQEFGLQLPTHIMPNMQKVVEQYVMTACKPVIDDGSAIITGVEVETDGTKVLAIVRWIDNRTQSNNNTSVQLG